MTQDGRADEAPAALTIEIITLFPEVMAGFLSATVIGRAIEAGVLAVHCTNPRDFAPGRHRQVDDSPYGGGPGMILSVEPIAAALEAIAAARGPSRRILLTPRGALFDQTRAREVAAAAIIEAVARLGPGVLGCALSASDESFSAGRLEYPQWTRPATWNGQAVPGVLLSGDHQAIARWRRREALKVTEARRPDLLATHPLTDEERRLLAASVEVTLEPSSEVSPKISSDKDT